ncbi:hypothetical protein OKA04_08020 [Luteolibacter flavescens]|uniref:DUF805 domain-containing protein n=2 Tax=Luteolibacter flavescens TaxID=1859460 RepID=A0ABT3FM75_9BACT|nr:hypothetical protein [Luteolibacter flavescens]
MMNFSAVLLFVAALASFAVFHFFPGFTETAGWKVWLEVWDMIQGLDFLDDPGEFAILASFLMITVLIVVSPFLTAVFRKSRLCWWMATVMSGVASIAFLVLVLDINETKSLGKGGWCLLAAPVLNLGGFLMIRGASEKGDGSPFGA